MNNLSKQRGVCERITEEGSSTAFDSDISICDVYPLMFVRTIFQYIHDQAGFTFSGDFFTTDYWRELLYANYSNFYISDDEVEAKLSTTEIEETQITLVTTSATALPISTHNLIKYETYTGSFNSFF
jgi:hypothetical protein